MSSIKKDSQLTIGNHYSLKLTYANAICIGILILVVWGSVWQSYYTYSPHEWGLMLGNAKDLFDGKRPYEQIFIQYGFLTTFIHAMAYGWAGGNLVSIVTITAVAYAIGLWFIFRTTLSLTGSIKIALFVLVTCFLIHPSIIYPWSNYIAFPFLVYGISKLVNKHQNRRTFFLAGISFGLAILSRENLAPSIVLLIIMSTFLDILHPDQNRKESLISAALIMAGLLLPVAVFIIYIAQHGLLIYWYKLSWLLPRIYAMKVFPHVSGGGVFNMLLNAIWSGMIRLDYRWLLFGMAIAVNMYLIILIVARSKRPYLTSGGVKIAFATLLLLSSAVHLPEIFRLATGSMIGVITLYVVLNHYKQANRVFIVVLLGGTLGYTLIWWLGINNNYLPNRESMKNAQAVTSPSFFKEQRWPEHVIQYYQSINSDLRTLENSRCGIAFHFNATYDAFLQVLSPFSQYQIAPFGVGPSQFADASKEINALRPDFDLGKKIGAATDIILFLHLPEKDFASYQPPKGFFVYRNYASPTTETMIGPGYGYRLLILAPRICLEPLQRHRSLLF